MSQYGGYGNPYYGGYYTYDNQTPFYGYGQPDYVTGHAEGSGSSFHNFEDNQPPHGYPRIYPEYQSQYDFNPSRSTPQSSYLQDHARSDDDHRNFLVPEIEYQVPTTSFPSSSYSIKGKERQSQNFGQSPHSEIQSFKGKERQYQDFEESLDGDKSKERQTPLQGYEEIETDEDKILNPEIPATSPRRSGLRYEGLLKEHPLRDFDTVGELKQWAQDWAWSQGQQISKWNIENYIINKLEETPCKRPPTEGRTIISNRKNEFFTIVEYRAFADMTLEERKDWNELSMGLFKEKKFTNPVRINLKIKRGSMWPIGVLESIGPEKKIKSYEAEWNRRGPLLEKMNMVLAGSFKHVADGWFHKSMKEFNEKGLPAFSATLMNNNPPEAFSSALTFTTSRFENTPHIDNDRWWMQVNKKMGEVNMDENKEVHYFSQENVKIDFSKVNWYLSNYLDGKQGLSLNITIQRYKK
ncbi:hypothetical protein PPACK8108_LOCUS9683 [Phakopsora pachyrhizi]|uniref:Tet-like 2OG-Fe(II) oxygenase domain-containing protein n=1 Tax=Phakopsora pachyrhizi TaxID=170000 RepID=A0AAV0AWX7_PHAPC|nr:hypothetical protein PPACK8108_LOCUS9683 [Phakopsora pachyrhizi]